MLSQADRVRPIWAMRSAPYFGRRNFREPDFLTCAHWLRLGHPQIFKVALACLSKCRVGILALLVLRFTANFANAQTPDGFNPGSSGTVFAVAVQPDAKLIIGGAFQSVAGQTRNYIARLNSDATLDTNFVASADNSVFCLSVLTNGMTLAGGSFSGLGGMPHRGIGRLLTNGAPDFSFTASISVPFPLGGGAVYSLQIQSDSKILVGGTFTSLSGAARNNFGRLNADGTIDSLFNPSPNNIVISSAIQPDGKILVGGAFTTLGGQLRNCIGRLNSNGSLDTTFNPGANTNVNCLAVQPDGKILVGGAFTNLAGQPARYLGRLNADGTFDPTFAATASSNVYCFALQADAKIFVGGAFTNINAQPVSRLCRLNSDGTLDGTFTTAASNVVYSLTIQPNGSIVAGGAFTSLGGQTRNRIGRLTNPTPSTEDLAWSSSTITWTRADASPEIWRTTFESTLTGTNWNLLGAGSRIAGGWQLAGQPFQSNALLRARGFVTGGYENSSSWFSEKYVGPMIIFAQPRNSTNSIGSAVTFQVGVLGPQPLQFQWLRDGGILSNGGRVSGALTSSLTISNLTLTDIAGYSVIITNASGSVTSQVAQLVVLDPFIVTQPASQWVAEGSTASFTVVAGGSSPPFTYQWRKNGLPLNQFSTSLTIPNVQMPNAGLYDVVITSPQGSVASAPATLGTVDTFAPGIGNPSQTFAVYSLAVQRDNKILVGGNFTSVGGQPRLNIGRLSADGTVDLGFHPDASNIAYSFAIQPDGKIVVGGFFTNLAGIACTNLGRLNSDGTLDTGFVPNPNSSVRHLRIQRDGKIIVGGVFTSIAGQPRNYLARLNLDGSVDATFNPLLSSSVDCLAIQDNGTIFVGGFLAANPMIKFFSDGTRDTNFVSPGSGLRCLAVQPDGLILVGGSFTNLAGQPRNNIARLRPDGTLDSNFNPGAGGTLYSIAIQADGRILVSGAFSNLGGQPCSGLGRLFPDGTLDPSYKPGAGTVFALTVQPDGKVLAGGTFTTLAGQSCQNLGRLSNTDPATNVLQFNGSTVTWLRNATAPDLYGVTFDFSTNGISWASLGAATRIVGGWQSTNVMLPPNTSIRGRGFSSVSGSGASSSSLEESIIGAPAIEDAPFFLTNSAGSTATIMVTAGGTPPLSYQWYKGSIPLQNGGNISGANSNTLVVANLLHNDAADYSVAICNGMGCVTGLVCSLTVIEPAILVQPLAQAVHAGQSVSVSVTVAGTLPIVYQWRKNGAAIPSATSSALSLTNVQASDAAGYDVAITNQYGSVTSLTAALEVNLALADSWNPGLNGDVLTIASQPDGRILVGGYFSDVAGSGLKFIARFEKNGSLETPFNLSPDYNNVCCLAVQPDSKLLVGGGFSTLDGQPCDELGRVIADGSFDSGFKAGSGGQLLTLALQGDGKVLVGGSSSLIQPPNTIGRLNSTGTLDSSFVATATGGDSAFPTVWCVVLQPDNKILLGGNFTQVDGQARNYIARVDENGFVDNSFNPGADAEIYALSIQADGKILVGGAFKNLGGSPRRFIGRLNADGTLDPVFNPGASNVVNSFALQTDGKIITAGFFTNLGGFQRNRLARLNQDGSIDTTFNPGADDGVNMVSLESDGSVLVGGHFLNLAGQSRNYFGRLRPTTPALQTLAFDGSQVTWTRQGPSPEVWRTTFEFSTNAADWVMLGTGTRISNGWQIVSSGVPAGSLIRARGYISTAGYFGSANGLIETTLDQRLRIILDDSHLGISSNHFGFTIAGYSGEVAVIETSTNLLNWIALATNSFQSDTLFFSDPATMTGPRFYRVHSP